MLAPNCKEEFDNLHTRQKKICKERLISPFAQKFPSIVKLSSDIEQMLIFSSMSPLQVNLYLVINQISVYLWRRFIEGLPCTALEEGEYGRWYLTL